MIFQCKNCGGNVIYSPERKGMYCPYCDSEKSEQRKDTEGDIHVCPNCGGEVPVDEYTSSTKCPYCDNYIILNERIEGMNAPQMIIPFQHSREMVKKLLREKFKRCTFAPTDFLSEARLNTMEGDYGPFWLYDYDENYVYRAEGRKIRVWVTGDTEFKETSIYDVYRDVDVKFSRIPADASVKMPDDVMDLMEPYNYEQMEPFKPEYMSGFMGEKFSVVPKEAEVRTRKKMEEDTVSLVKQTVSGYGSLSERERHLSVKEQRANMGLLPVWKYEYRYRDKAYPFYINGQTAKIVGKVPVSARKVWAYGATLWAVLTVILICGYYGIMML